MLFRKFIESDLNRCFVRPRCAREQPCIHKRHSRGNKALYDLAARGNSIALPNAIPAGTAVLQLPGTTLHSQTLFPQEGQSPVGPRCAREQHYIPKCHSRGDRGPTIAGNKLAFPYTVPAGGAKPCRTSLREGTALHSPMPFPREPRSYNCLKAQLRPALVHLVLQTKLLPLLRGTFSIWLRLTAKLEVCLYSPLRTGCYQTSLH